MVEVRTGQFLKTKNMKTQNSIRRVQFLIHSVNQEHQPITNFNKNIFKIPCDFSKSYDVYIEACS